MPRNEWNPAYTAAVLDLGFRCIRGPSGHGVTEPTKEGTSMFCTAGQTGRHLHRSFASTHDGVERGSAFVRPVRRTSQCLPSPVRTRPQAVRTPAAAAAPVGNAPRGTHGRIFHLWWHPHNFSQHQPENLALLEMVLDEFERLAGAEGMQSLTMADVAARVSPTPPDGIGNID